MSDRVEDNVNTHSLLSDSRITDLRIANLSGIPMRKVSIIRLDTNQGLVGYGEVRDGASETYALMLKRHLIGENPCSVDKLFRKIKQFGHHARQAGGVCGIEMALTDLAGKGVCGCPPTNWQAASFAIRYCAIAIRPPKKMAGRLESV